ncbi:MAG: hypothetical protein U9Q06_04055 [Nanoarchaeota archaeon]|nr:hypothetical protein [Nanoarchaeota archaeon]
MVITTLRHGQEVQDPVQKDITIYLNTDGPCNPLLSHNLGPTYVEIKRNDETKRVNIGKNGETEIGAFDVYPWYTEINEAYVDESGIHMEAQVPTRFFPGFRKRKERNIFIPREEFPN